MGRRVRVRSVMHRFRMIATMKDHTTSLDRLFDTDWNRVSASAEMVSAAQRWHREAPDVIPTPDVGELLGLIENPAEPTASRDVSRWLLVADEPMARRVVIQACRGMAFEHCVAGRHRGCDPATVCAAVVLAIGEVSGRRFAWPMRRIRSEMRAELFDRPKRLATSEGCAGSSVDPDEIATPEAVDHAIELSRMLKAAVDQARLSETDAQVTWLTTIGGVAPADIAAAMFVSPAAVRKRKERSIRSMSAMASAQLAAV